MYRNRRIAVVIPIHNEEAFVERTVSSVPDFVDHIILVDDGSSDGTLQAVANIQNQNLHLITHKRNLGVGAATVSGYRGAEAIGADIAAVMDGDGQMDPGDLPALLDAVITGKLNYAKGNRFLHPSVRSMPKTRYIGNRILSGLMRLGLGMSDPLDAQCGYTAISREALAAVDLEGLYPRYGSLNALMFRLKAAGMKTGSVPVRTIYGEEVSGINPFVTVPIILGIILLGYLRRILTTESTEITEREISL